MSDGRGARLFTDLNNILRRDPHIDEYDVIPVIEPKHNKSPFMVVDHKLGIELWCISILYQYSYNKLLSWRSKDGAEKYLEPSEVGHLCRAVLLVNPECYTFWNIRKEGVESGEINIEDDLKLGKLILTKHPKSPETFIHRRWLLHRFINTSLMASNDSSHSNSSVESTDQTIGTDNIFVNFLPTNQNSCSNNHILPLQIHADLNRTIQEEFDVCWQAAEHYPCNYNSWSHRIWIIQTVYNSNVKILLSEIHKTVTWFTQHVSDHSGFHYRQFLLTSLINQSQTVSQKFHIDINELLKQEYDKTIDLIGYYPGHEALWYHRKYIIYTIYKDNMKSKHLRETIIKENGVNLKRSRIEKDESDTIETEIQTVTRTMKDDCDKHQVELAQRYLQWLKRILKV